MALKLTNLLQNVRRLGAIKVRQASQYYPIDEYIFGLSDEQIQVGCWLSANRNAIISLFLAQRYHFYFCPKRIGSLCT